METEKATRRMFRIFDEAKPLASVKVNPNISIEYDGEYPNLCSGNLVVTIDGKRWDFPKYCLVSGGGVGFDKDWLEEIDTGPWTVREWPYNFPENHKKAVLTAINEQIPHGCCGGCV
jgi:hypothetical protein